MNISEKQNDSIEYLKMIIQNANVECPTEKEFIEDWGINGSETLAQLQEFASDYISEAHTTMCENKNSWRYDV